MIRVENLVFEYPTKRALFDISLEISAGGITALVGPNGAGKTTLINCLVGLHQPMSGKVRFDDLVVAEQPRAAHRRMGYLPDFYELYDELTVRQCLVHGAEMRGIGRADSLKRAEVSADRLQVADRLDDKVSSLSRGLKQRAAIARAIIHEPEFLVLDEPAAGLDPDARAKLSALFRQLQGDGMTLLVSSHILAELEDYCSEMIIIRDGRIVDHGSANDAPEQAALRHISVGLAEPHPDTEAIIAAQEGVSGVQVEGTQVRLALNGGKSLQMALLKQLVEAGLPVIRFQDEQERLQDTYHRAVNNKQGDEI